MKILSHCLPEDKVLGVDVNTVQQHDYGLQKTKKNKDKYEHQHLKT